MGWRGAMNTEGWDMGTWRLERGLRTGNWAFTRCRRCLR
jgi:hypothetical protein